MVSQRKYSSVLKSESEMLTLIKGQIPTTLNQTRDEIGIGDDAAVVGFEHGNLVLTTDTMVEDVHFRRGEIRWQDLGWKSIVSNQSDIAAMGGKPEHALVSLAITNDVIDSDINNLFAGMAGALDTFGGRLVGGDTVLSSVISIGVAMTGSGITASQALKRDMARVGDLVTVTGYLGGSAGGLATLGWSDISDEDATPHSQISQLREAHFRPRPRTDMASVMVMNGVRCAMDISDGLLIDLERICTASGVDAVIHAGQVPVHPALYDTFPDRALDMAMTGGEDYEILYATDEKTISRINANQPDKYASDFGIVGEFIEASDGKGGNVRVVDSKGETIEMHSRGWDHFTIER